MPQKLKDWINGHPRCWAAVFFIVLLATAVPAGRRIWKGNTGDFEHFWHAYGAMLHGQDIYASGTGYYIYPPLAAFIFQPLALLSERDAGLVWLFCNFILTGLAAILAAREIARHWRPESHNPSLTWFVAAVSAVLIMDKLRANLQLGQIDCLMLLGFVLVLRWMDRSPICAGLAAGITANLKYLTLIFVPYFLLRRNYKAALASILSFVFFLFIPAAQVGTQQASSYASQALGGIGNLLGLSHTSGPEKMPDVVWDRSVSLTSAAFRTSDALMFPKGIGIILVALIFACLAFALIYIARSRGAKVFGRITVNALPQMCLEWTILIVLATVFSPHATARQFLYLFPVFALALFVLCDERLAGQRMPLVSAVILMMLGLSFPPFGIGLNKAYWAWRFIGGPSWCAVILLLTLTASAAKLLDPPGAKTR